MRLLARRLGLVASLAAGLGPLGCSSNASSTTAVVIPPPPPDTATVAFDDPGTLTLAWGQSAALHVSATPAMAYRVGFSLLGAFDSTFDGSLDSAVVVTGADGHGVVTLHAPSQSTTFLVRASLLGPDGLPGASAERAVSVSQQGFGSVRAVPTYLGHRTVGTWTAAVATSTTCADLQSKGKGPVPADPQGAISASAPAGSNPVVGTAPVGPNLAVLLRAGHFAWGCADTTMLTAGTTLDVPVTVLDVPLDLADADLATTFSFTPDPTAYASVLGDAVSGLVDVFMPLSSTEGTIVLNGMAAATTDPGTFAALRVQKSWDTLADAHFAALPKSLRDTCGAWATTGAAAQPTTFKAALAGGPGGALTLTVTQFGSLDPTSAGVTAAPGATWSGLPDDSIQLNGTLIWEPSRFAGAASFAPAFAKTGQPTVADALSQEADCAGLAAALGAFSTCDLPCVTNLCETAIAARWTSALAASKDASALGQILIQGAGNTTVGDLAQPITLDGAWQGQIGDAATQVQVKGGAVMGAQAMPAQ